MTGFDPRLQNDRDRRLRYDRRDRSPIPLNQIEAAERRHHFAVGVWRRVFIFGPIVFAALAEIVFGGVGAAAITVGLLHAAALLAAALILAVVSDRFSTGSNTWLIVHAVAFGAAGLVALIVVNHGASLNNWPMNEVAVAAVAALFLVFWPALWRKWRWSHPTDYERLVWASQNARPRGIIE